MEATESPSTVLSYYDELLQANSANAVGFINKEQLQDAERAIYTYRPYGNGAYPFFDVSGS